MSHSYKILKAQVERDHVAKRDFLDVTIQVYLDGKKLGGLRRFAFGMKTGKKAIRAELDRVIASLDQDAEHALANADYERQQENAKETIKGLMGKTKKESKTKS